ncbi:helix-turn-helix transcriptional regulator [Epibacterium ulvae]|uniref:winged helix-turn-helix transcriptional regulator n=1 Tax=Epibacterium ulvae TaxID=1156985 RepID=UPI001BFC4F06|nr:helix-turn-helix domain-containing protein [Epibacterium ulvae]MBT8153694.1 helix-turn-helix transcriptional regulator [Epibacterium ulvae]
MATVGSSCLGCPMDPVLKAVTGRWTTTILWNLSTESPLRFGELMGLMPAISAKVLTDRLRMLEQNGIVLRTQKSTIPPEVSYELTTHGQDLHQALRSLHEVALKWNAEGWVPGQGFPEDQVARAAE